MFNSNVQNNFPVKNGPNLAKHDQNQEFKPDSSFGKYVDFEEIKARKPLISAKKYAKQFAIVGAVREAIALVVSMVGQNELTTTQNLIADLPGSFMLGVTLPLAYAYANKKGHSFVPYVLGACFVSTTISTVPTVLLKQHFAEQNKKMLSLPNPVTSAFDKTSADIISAHKNAIVWPRFENKPIVQ